MIYRVTGTTAYLNHAPGETFVAQLDRGAQERAIARGAIEVIDATPVALDETRAGLPRGWNTTRGSAAEKGD